MGGEKLSWGRNKKKAVVFQKELVGIASSRRES